MRKFLIALAAVGIAFGSYHLPNAMYEGRVISVAIQAFVLALNIGLFFYHLSKIDENA